MGSLTLASLVLVRAVATAFHAAPAQPPNVLRVLWVVDMDGSCPVSEGTVTTEVRRIFGSAGLEVEWQSGVSSSVSTPDVVRVTVLSKDRARRKQAPMGATIDTHVFVLCSEVARALTVGGRRSNGPELSRAVGRVVAHELVHALAPRIKHARFGLMAHSLTAAALTQPGLFLDPDTRRTLRKEIEEFVRR